MIVLEAKNQLFEPHQPTTTSSLQLVDWDKHLCHFQVAFN